MAAVAGPATHDPPAELASWRCGRCAYGITIARPPEGVRCPMCRRSHWLPAPRKETR